MTAGGHSTRACGTKQLEGCLSFGIAALSSFYGAVVGFRKGLAIIFGLLRIERSALQLELGKLGCGIVHFVCFKIIPGRGNGFARSLRARGGRGFGRSLVCRGGFRRLSDRWGNFFLGVTTGDHDEHDDAGEACANSLHSWTL